MINVKSWDFFAVRIGRPFVSPLFGGTDSHLTREEAFELEAIKAQIEKQAREFEGFDCGHWAVEQEYPEPYFGKCDVIGLNCDVVEVRYMFKRR